MTEFISLQLFNSNPIFLLAGGWRSFSFPRGHFWSPSSLSPQSEGLQRLNESCWCFKHLADSSTTILRYTTFQRLLCLDYAYPDKNNLPILKSAVSFHLANPGRKIHHIQLGDCPGFIPQREQILREILGFWLTHPTCYFWLINWSLKQVFTLIQNLHQLHLEKYFQLLCQVYFRYSN